MSTHAEHHAVVGGHHVEHDGEQNENAHHEKLEEQVGVLAAMWIQSGDVSGRAERGRPKLKSLVIGRW